MAPTTEPAGRAARVADVDTVILGGGWSGLQNLADSAERVYLFQRIQEWRDTAITRDLTLPST
jgi:hypothetical protein